MNLRVSQDPGVHTGIQEHRHPESCHLLDLHLQNRRKTEFLHIESHHSQGFHPLTSETIMSTCNLNFRWTTHFDISSDSRIFSFSLSLHFRVKTPGNLPIWEIQATPPADSHHMWKLGMNNIPTNSSTQGAGIPFVWGEKEITIPNVVTCQNSFCIDIELRTAV